VNWQVLDENEFNCHDLDCHDLDCCGPDEATPHLDQEVAALVSRLGKSHHEPSG